ncbi:MAG: OmpA family protein, partial [Lysobacteraceae bacterium]
ATGAVTVAAGTPAGTYTLVYQICEQLNPTNCDTATVTVTVGAAVIDAVDDSFGPANGATGNPTAGNAYTNDTLNGVAVNVADITGTVTTPATLINGGPVPVLDPQTGNVSVPAGTPAGTYMIVYRICENLNPANCDTATITVTVDAAPIDAVDDAFPPVNGVGGGSTASVLVNDTLNGVAVNPADVTLTPGIAPTPTSGSIVMNPDGTITIAPNTEAGTYTYPYTICEVLNPNNCDTAIATVVVSAQPGLTIDKIAGAPNASAAGGTIPYSFVVTNTGNVTVTGLTINDAQLSAAAVCPTTTLAPGATTTCTGSHTITQVEVDAGTVVNTATATGTLPGGGTTVSPPDSTTTTIVQTPAITAVKTATLTTDGGLPGLADPGDVITYSVTVQNTGNVTLGSLVVNDSFEGGAATTLNCAPATLAPGATATCASYTHTVTVAEAAAGGTLDNVATATATSSTATQTVTSTSTAVVNVNGDPAAIRITKTASPRDVKVGDLVRYTLTMRNTSITPMVDGTLIDTPPAGFTYVEGSLAVADADNAGRLVGTYPIRVDQLDIAGEGSATITYLLRVGAGVRPGVHTNSAYVEDNGEVVSNVATANVQMTSDPLMDESLIVGTVFNDRDGDRWQDPAGLGGVRVQGGFAPEAYVPNSTTVDRGTGPTPESDASSPMLHGIDVGDIAARQSEADPVARHTVVIRQTLRDLRFTDDFVLTSAQGVTVRMTADGKTSVDKTGDAAKGLNAAEPTVERRVSQVADGYVVDYVIANAGIDERGIPGVRIASVEGLLMETDQYGRYHLTGVDGGRERGRNFILKIDPATLPPGTTFTTDNPLVKRVTPGVPTRFDFGVKMPVTMLEGGAQTVEMELGEIVFHAESAKLREEYLPVIEKIAVQVRSHGNGEVVLAANGETQALAYDRAKAVQTALLGMLSKDEAQAVKISLRTDLADPDSTLVSLGESPVLGMVLFDTDQSAIKPEFEPVIAKVAADIERLRGGVVGIIGHADKRGSAEYNVALGMRRAKAVYEAIAAKLSPEVRSKLRVDFSDNPTAPVGIRGQ